MKHRNCKKNFCGAFLALATLALLGMSSPLAASVPPPFLVKDINPYGASTPAELATMGGITYFVANDGIYGAELWRSDGTVGGTVLVQDICPGACGSAPVRLTVATVPTGEFLFFNADNGSLGYELWRSDGTTLGTVIVKDINPGPAQAEINSLTAGVNGVYFSARDNVYGHELWKSDGTAAGTVMVKNIQSGSGSSIPGNLTMVGNTLFFSAISFVGGELWKSDGTEAGTVLVRDINTGIGGSVPHNLTAVGNTLFFAAYTSLGFELWKSDGTSSGTMSVKNINPGAGHSFPTELTAFGNQLFFLADDGTSGMELWKSDGSFAGTVLVKDIRPGVSPSEASHLTVVDELLYFTADDGLVGKELWRSDGTYFGTWLVKDINPGPAGSGICEVRSVDGGAYFVADDGLSGSELWKSDGTGYGTELVGDLILGGVGSSPTEPTPSQTMVLFAADDAYYGRELWAVQFGGPVLTFNKVFNDEFVQIGTSAHTFDLTVSNTGSAPAAGVRITDAVDSRLTVTSVSPALQCAASTGQFVDCTFPTLDVSEVQTVTVTYSVAAGVTPADDVLNVADVGDLGGQLVQASDTVDVVDCGALPVDLLITDEEIYSPTYAREACRTISAGPVVSVMPGANVLLTAGGAVVLNNGFMVDDGGDLTVEAN